MSPEDLESTHVIIALIDELEIEARQHIALYLMEKENRERGLSVESRVIH